VVPSSDLFFCWKFIELHLVELAEAQDDLRLLQELFVSLIQLVEGNELFGGLGDLRGTSSLRRGEHELA